jgi:hypothetical protein
MRDTKLALATGLAAATLVLFLAVIAMGGALRRGSAPWPGIGAIVMAVAAFAVSWKQRSFGVAGLLAVSGLVGLVYGLIATEFLGSVAYRGPIFGVIIGTPIFGRAAWTSTLCDRSGSAITTRSMA